nr:unnamed protein product [Callosobruchus analis]
MMYPEVFKQFQVQPPRGVLHIPWFTRHREVLNSKSVRADLLSKWIGESEKQLKLLVERAAEKKPSIIFFDELNQLAPVRSSRQDRIGVTLTSSGLPTGQTPSTPLSGDQADSTASSSFCCRPEMNAKKYLKYISLLGPLLLLRKL